MERQEWGDMCEFRSLNDNTCKRVLNMLEPVKLTVGCNAASCIEVKIWADTAKFMNVIVARFRKCRDLVGEGKLFIKNKAKVASGVGCTVVVREQSCILESCCLSPIRRNSVSEELRVGHPPSSLLRVPGHRQTDEQTNEQSTDKQSLDVALSFRFSAGRGFY